MKELFQEAVKLLEDGKSFAMATIISKQGSAPRGIGTRMLITKDQIFGTVGGGSVEAKTISLARDEVLVNRRAVTEFHDMDATEASKAYMICGGNCEILTFYVDAEDCANLLIFRSALQAAAIGDMAWFVYRIGKGSFQYELSQNLVHDIREDQENKEPRVIIEPIVPGGTLYLFGGGHVSLAVAKLAVNLDFRVVVLEDRKDLLNSERFPGCECVLLKDFDHIPRLDINHSSYILIITRGHSHDYEVLEWALLQEPYYIGMIGSKNKRDQIYDKLIKKGADPKRLKEVCCPVGLNIGAETPEEIAISIMAQLIRERYKKHRQNQV